MWEILAWIPLAAAGISAAGSIAGGLLQQSGQADANRQSAQYNWDAMMENQRFQERMSNTAYQRAMNDMRHAGLNPILAYSQGGASSPAGSAASTRFENTMEGLGKGVTSASQMGQRALEMRQMMAQTDQTKTQATMNESSSDLNKANTIRAAQDTITSAADARRKDAETAYTMEQMQNPKALRDLWQAQGHSARTQGDLNIEQKNNPVPYVRQGSTFLRDLFGASREKDKPPERTNAKPSDPGGIIPNWLFGR